jgi:hypothetical protein
VRVGRRLRHPRSAGAIPVAGQQLGTGQPRAASVPRVVRDRQWGSTNSSVAAPAGPTRATSRGLHGLIGTVQRRVRIALFHSASEAVDLDTPDRPSPDRGSREHRAVREQSVAVVWRSGQPDSAEHFSEVRDRDRSLFWLITGRVDRLPRHARRHLVERVAGQRDPPPNPYAAIGGGSSGTEPPGQRPVLARDNPDIASSIRTNRAGQGRVTGSAHAPRRRMLVNAPPVATRVGCSRHDSACHPFLRLAGAAALYGRAALPTSRNRELLFQRSRVFQLLIWFPPL